MSFSVPDTNYPQQYSLFIESVEETHSGVYRAITPGEKKWGGCMHDSVIGRASAATVRSSKSRFAIDICLVRVNHTEHARQRSSPWR